MAPYVSVANLFSLPNVVGVFHDWDDGTTTRFYPPHLTRPWPSFGLTGDEGIYGYFGAGARSRAIPVALPVGS